MLLTFLICLRLSDIFYFERRKESSSICHHCRLSDIVYFERKKESSSICHHRCHRPRRHQVPAACDGPSRGWTRYHTPLLLFVLLLLPIIFLLVAPKKPAITGWCIIPHVCITTLRHSTNYFITNTITVSAKPAWPVLHTLLTFCSIFCYMNAMILFSFPCCPYRLSSQYILLSGQNMLWYIL